MIRISTNPPHPPTPHIVTSAAAALLDIAPAGVNNLAAAGLISRTPNGFRRTEIDILAALPVVGVSQGEIAVLRTTGQDGATTGVHIDMDAEILEQRCLRWWRGDTSRLLKCGMFVVTVSTIPVAVYWLNELVATRGSGLTRSHHLGGELIAHRRHGVCGGTSAQQELAAAALEGRIITPRGGPIAYLGDNALM